MKTLFALSGLLIATAANATSPYVGPWVGQEIGTPGKGGEWRLCRIMPYTAILTDSAGNEKIVKLDLTADQLAGYIAGASKAPTSHALHIMAQVPAITVKAGNVAGGINTFQVSRDASTFESRMGSDAEAIAELVNENCNK